MLLVAAAPEGEDGPKNGAPQHKPLSLESLGVDACGFRSQCEIHIHQLLLPSLLFMKMGSHLYYRAACNADFKKMNHSQFFLPSSALPHCCPRSQCSVSTLIWHRFMVSVRDHDF